MGTFEFAVDALQESEISETGRAFDGFACTTTVTQTQKGPPPSQATNTDYDLTDPCTTLQPPDEDSFCPTKINAKSEHQIDTQTNNTQVHSKNDAENCSHAVRNWRWACRCVRLQQRVWEHTHNSLLGMQCILDAAAKAEQLRGAKNIAPEVVECFSACVEAEELELLRTELAEKDEKLAEAEASISDLIVKSEQDAATVLDLHAVISSLQTQLAVSVGELSAEERVRRARLVQWIQKRLVDSNDRLVEAQLTIDRADEITADTRLVEAKYSAARAALKDKEARITALEAELDTCKSSRSRDAQAYRELQAENEKLQSLTNWIATHSEDNETKARELQEQARELQEQARELQEQLEEAQWRAVQQEEAHHTAVRDLEQIMLKHEQPVTAAGCPTPAWVATELDVQGQVAESCPSEDILKAIMSSVANLERMVTPETLPTAFPTLPAPSIVPSLFREVILAEGEMGKDLDMLHGFAAHGGDAAICVSDVPFHFP
ncbi:hypothetical protein CYMTET_38693 [Cymbomonas tetramitiformis]|uniref:Uncharacterized protein n=1 Tax=Cymbomonas tetramitiformis TaxID=36881 RepID=A0AAE0F507_9CHLO|nr:hypothetical protein CYMTET_38695 [Cymbomonas tetramitiformis]KAK3251993.1 hypothetical protein CYMTET_38693 [Cymbomonas tetramitiformis]